MRQAPGGAARPDLVDQEGLERVEALLDGTDVPALQKAVADLSQRTAQVADDVLGAAVKKALSEGQ